MTQEHSEIKPIVNVEKFSLLNLLSAFFDSPIIRTRIHIGTLDKDGKTVITGKKSIQADNVEAKPGDKVITHEI